MQAPLCFPTKWIWGRVAAREGLNAVEQKNLSPEGNWTPIPQSLNQQRTNHTETAVRIPNHTHTPGGGRPERKVKPYMESFVLWTWFVCKTFERQQSWVWREEWILGTGIKTYQSARAETACGIVCILIKVTTQSYLSVNFSLNHRTSYMLMNVAVSWAATLFSNSNIPEANMTHTRTHAYTHTQFGYPNRGFS